MMPPSEYDKMGRGWLKLMALAAGAAGLSWWVSTWVTWSWLRDLQLVLVGVNLGFAVGHFIRWSSNRKMAREARERLDQIGRCPSCSIPFAWMAEEPWTDRTPLGMACSSCRARGCGLCWLTHQAKHKETCRATKGEEVARMILLAQDGTPIMAEQQPVKTVPDPTANGG